MKLYIGSYFAFYTHSRRHWTEVSVERPTPLVDILSSLGIPAAEVYLIVVNGELVESPDILVTHDDLVRIYPAIGGG